MNTHPSNSSRAKHSSPAPFHSASREASSSVYDTATRFPAFATIPSATGEDLFSQFWTPGLLDRLQAPITRYRE
jgi:hypothetical protein